MKQSLRAKLADIGKLAESTDAIWQASSQRLQILFRQREALEKQLAELSRAQTEAHGHLAADPSQAAQIAKWLRWSDLERRRLNARLAKLQVETERELIAARQAFGRNQAVHEIRKRVIGGSR